MRDMLKCVAALATISIVCAALLLIGSIFLPKQVRVFNYGDYLNDANAVFEKVELDTLDENLVKNVTEIHKAIEGSAVGGYVIKSTGVSAFDSNVIEMITGVSQNGKIVKVGFVQVITPNGTIWKHPFNEANFKIFEGKDPNALTYLDFTTSGATSTTNVMISTVRTAYRLALALITEVPPEPIDPNIELVQPYFTQLVKSAVLSTAVSLPANVTVYDVVLKDDVRAWAVIDRNTYYKFDIASDGRGGLNLTSMREVANGTFYISETSLGVYFDGTEYRFGKLIAKPKGYAPAGAAFLSTVSLEGQKLGKVSNSTYVDLIDAVAGASNVIISGATATGINAVKNVNKMVDYISTYVHSTQSGEAMATDFGGAL